MNSDTIVAIATPPGRGGVGVVRVSGPLAYRIAQSLSDCDTIPLRKAHYSKWFTQDGELLDQGLLLYFKAPHSFTGEDVLELQGHGAPIVLDAIVNECVSLGARLANPGEFSERAFLNDKMDLTQAEAIADLIDASSKTAARMAMRSLQGDFSQKIHALNEQLIHLRLYVEAAIDFPEEEIDFLSDGHVLSELNSILDALQAIRSGAHQGVLLREGLSVVIAGRPNAGKSTLINALAGRDLAIVTEMAGTTRDVMRADILLDDIPLHIMDTAGLRESDDRVEQEGIKRAWQEVGRADCLLFIIDVCDCDTVDTLQTSLEAARAPEVPIIRIFNKIDQITGLEKVRVFEEDKHHTVFLSAKTGEGLSQLKALIKQLVGYQPAEGQFLARRRHIHALDLAKEHLLIGLRQLSEHRAGELLAEDLRLAHEALCCITGEFSSDDLLGKIFSSFCIGK